MIKNEKCMLALLWASNGPGVKWLLPQFIVGGVAVMGVDYSPATRDYSASLGAIHKWLAVRSQNERSLAQCRRRRCTAKTRVILRQ